MLVTPPPGPAPPTLRQLHLRRCFLLGITEGWKIEKLWQEELKKRGGNKRGGKAP